MTPAQIALAWLLSKPDLVARVAGVWNLEWLQQKLPPLNLRRYAYLDEFYRPAGICSRPDHPEAISEAKSLEFGR